jgi:ABC-type phosphate/phosphonate transport system substrate-binding protein
MPRPVSPPEASRDYRWIYVICALFFFAAQATKPGACEEKSIHIGYPSKLFAEVDRRDARAAMEIWVKTMAKKMNKHYNLIYVEIDELQAIEKALKERRIDLIGMPALDFVKIRKHVQLDPALADLKGKSVADQFVLLVRRDKGIKSIGQLVNKRFLVEIGFKKEIELLWLDTFLLRRGLPKSSSFFSSIKDVQKPSQAILPIFFDQADACLVTALSYEIVLELNPQLGRELTELARSPEYLRHIVCFRSDFDPAAKKDLTEALPHLQDYVEGRQVLTLFKSDELVTYDPAWIRSLENLVEDHKNLMRRKNGKSRG